VSAFFVAGEWPQNRGRSSLQTNLPQFVRGSRPRWWSVWRYRPSCDSHKNKTANHRHHAQGNDDKAADSDSGCNSERAAEALLGCFDWFMRHPVSEVELVALRGLHCRRHGALRLVATWWRRNNGATRHAKLASAIWALDGLTGQRWVVLQLRLAMRAGNEHVQLP
jgi:hypothetical protein